MNLFCLLVAWSLSIGTLTTLIGYGLVGFRQVRQLHSIPCSKCQYFIDSRYLKCPVNPHSACSVAAIDCQDFTPLPTTNRSRRSPNRAFAHTLDIQTR